MAHALAEFVRQQMDERGLRNRDLERLSGLSRALVSKYVTDQREKLTRLPNKATLDGLAKALGVSSEFLLGKAIEAMDLGYTSGDFINSVRTAENRELIDEIQRRLDERGEGHAGSAASKVPAPSPAEQLGKDDYDLAAHDEDSTIEDEQHGE